MDESHLYAKIADSVRQQVLNSRLKPGERLPSVREMSAQWGCTIGTVQRAYGELARQGLVTSRAGQGTRIVEQPNLPGETPLRRAALIHRAEAFLLEAMTAGYTVPEIERASRLAMDRWRTVELEPQRAASTALRFTGSHDLVVAWLAGQLAEVAPGYSLEVCFSGSLQGLMALCEGKADLAGSHLWDEETDTYNAPFVRRLLPSQRIALITLANRRIGLILPEGNPRQLAGLRDLEKPGVRLATRQPGSGTRVWLDAVLRQEGISPEQIEGAGAPYMTHSAVALAVAEGRADAGIGLQAAALSYGLNFVLLTRERYDLVVSEEKFALEPIQALVSWLSSSNTRQWIETLGGYDCVDAGNVRWVE